MKAREILDKTHAMKRPFCGNHHINNEPGKTSCLECYAKFEIEDTMVLYVMFVGSFKRRQAGHVLIVVKSYISHGDENFIICCAG